MKNFIKAIYIRNLEKRIGFLQAKYNEAIDKSLFYRKVADNATNVNAVANNLFRARAYRRAAQSYIDDCENLKLKLNKLKA